MKKIVSIFIIFTLILTGLGLNIGHAEAKKMNKNQYTGEELFDGLYFGKGNAFKEFTSIWGEEQVEISPETDEFIKEVKEDLLSDNKKFYKGFEKALTSNDPVKVEEMMLVVDESIQKTINRLVAANNVAQPNTDDVVSKAVKPGFVAWAAYAYVAATHIAVAAVTVVAAAGTYVYAGTKFWGGKSANNENDRLSKEMVISEITTNLAK